jgi:hypothetical protein
MLDGPDDFESTLVLACTLRISVLSIVTFNISPFLIWIDQLSKVFIAVLMMSSFSANIRTLTLEIMNFHVTSKFC